MDVRSVPCNFWDFQTIAVWLPRRMFSHLDEFQICMFFCPTAGTLFPVRLCIPSRQPGCWAKRTAAWDNATKLANICETAWVGTQLRVLLTEYVARGMSRCQWNWWALKCPSVSCSCRTGGRNSECGFWIKPGMGFNMAKANRVICGLIHNLPLGPPSL